ncbi:LLM class flavin-dependent oxidoreductase [Microbacterium sp. RURRCA19A]|uniref:LLM class flavin-dependent oxidoreductase n=1 Tax=Microbacterium sp. RURRCA19A TaxID=1907391 RepID=UPI000956D968|nr:LLM class flavin-dependent oxidoreductase [Microbacterium sp. RURRCA19A]SIR97671.1 Luciferase-like monooxygenase [Microbacterium sp. RURRCA19A]
MLIGLQTFAEVPVRDGVPQSHGETLRQTVEAAVLAERVGLHAFTIGEHHRVDYPVPSPEMRGSSPTRTPREG